jgi:hypothetical protein
MLGDASSDPEFVMRLGLKDLGPIVRLVQTILNGARLAKNLKL